MLKVIISVFFQNFRAKHMDGDGIVTLTLIPINLVNQAGCRSGKYCAITFSTKCRLLYYVQQTCPISRKTSCYCVTAVDLQNMWLIPVDLCLLFGRTEHWFVSPSMIPKRAGSLQASSIHNFSKCEAVTSIKTHPCFATFQIEKKISMEDVVV